MPKSQSQPPASRTPAASKKKTNDFDAWGLPKKKSPILDEDDFDFDMDDRGSAFGGDRASFGAVKHMPTFGANRGGSSQYSGSKKKDEEEDEFDNIIDSIVGKEDIEERKRQEEEANRPKRKPYVKNTSSMPIDTASLPGDSSKKDEIERRKRALFGFSGSSEGKGQKLNFGARSQIGPDDGHRGIGPSFEKDQTNSSIGQNQNLQNSVIDSSPIGVIATKNTRRVARKASSNANNSLPRNPQQRVKTADPSGHASLGNDRFNRNVNPLPNFDRNDLGTNTNPKPPLPSSSAHPHLINDDDDDDFARDDEQDILGLMDAPDSRENQSRPSITPKKTAKFKNPAIEHDEDEDEDLFSGGYVPSTMSKNKQDDSKSRDKYHTGEKSDVSNEATPLSRGRKQMITHDAGSRQKDSRDSFSPPEIVEGNYISNRNIKQPVLKQGKSYDPNMNRKSSIGVIPTNKSKAPTARTNIESQVPLDEVSRAKLELEEARNKTFEAEKKMKREVDQTKLEQKKDIMNLESHHNKILDSHNREIKRMIDDMNMSIKQEREKLELINQSETNNKRKQYELELEKQKETYSQQNSVFENQLRQQIELNKMLDQVKTSSTNIESTLSQLSEDKSRGVTFQIDDLEKKERDFSEKLRSIQYETTETEKRVLNCEKDIQDFRVKQEIMKQEQSKDLEGNRDSMRQGENHYKRVVDETDLKQQEAEINIQRINREIQELHQEYDDKISAVELERKIVISERHHLVELIQMERQNVDRKFHELEGLDQELNQEEMDYEQRRAEFGQREAEINEEYNQLKARQEVFDDEQNRYNDEAMRVHQYSLQVQQESERIANFKFNYDAMRKELENSREIIARERAIIKTEKMRHLELLGELETKQRALELIRTEYIKDRGDIATQMWSIKRPLDYKVDLKPPKFKETTETIVSVNFLKFRIHMSNQLQSEIHYHIVK